MERISILKSKWFKKEVDKLQSEGMSKADIARQLDILPQYINSLMSGARNITDQFLDKFIEAYNINRFDLLPKSESSGEVLSDNKEHPNSYTSAIEGKLLEELIEQKLGSKSDSISMSREVFEQISRLTETVLSQQRTIESMQEQNKKFLAQQENIARCMHVSGSDISTIDIKSQNIK